MLRLGHFQRGYLVEEARKARVAERIEREEKEAIRAEAARVRRVERGSRTLPEILDAADEYLAMGLMPFLKAVNDLDDDA